MGILMVWITPLAASPEFIRLNMAFFTVSRLVPCVFLITAWAAPWAWSSALATAMALLASSFYFANHCLLVRFITRATDGFQEADDEMAAAILSTCPVLPV